MRAISIIGRYTYVVPVRATHLQATTPLLAKAVEIAIAYYIFEAVAT